MPTSITLEPDIKEEHEALKPDSLTWSEYMQILVRSIDADRFEELVEGFYQREYESAVERARERYDQAREDPDSLLDPDEARQRLGEDTSS